MLTVDGKNCTTNTKFIANLTLTLAKAIRLHTHQKLISGKLFMPVYRFISQSELVQFIATRC